MKKLDEKILNLCTKFAHWLQRTTGLTSYFVAKIGIGILFLSALSIIITFFQRYLFNESGIIEVTLILATSSYLIILLIRSIYSIDKLKEYFDSGPEGVKSITSETIRNELYLLRLFWILFAAYEFFFSSLPNYLHTKSLALEIISSLAGPAILVILYFLAVNPLPPGKNKIREWAEQFKFRRLEPAPIPKD